MSDTSTTHDEMRRAAAMARAVVTRDFSAYSALAPKEPGEWRALAEAAVTALATIARDIRLRGAEKELDTLITASIQLDSQRDMP
ncbi:UNVERIFIED_ORG: N-acetylglucosamine-6-phosphate deacetylase [Arthrobacter globiformis]|nr:N-acetylglucosamine-6-phosphate deacetylase [Arthrobacter globiformis]